MAGEIPESGDLTDMFDKDKSRSPNGSMTDVGASTNDTKFQDLPKLPHYPATS